MAYWTVADIRSKIWLVAAAEVADAIITQAIADGEAELHSYIDRAYTVPFDPVPDLINALSADIIRYRGQIRVSHKATNIHEPDKLAYENAIKILEYIRDGNMDIPGETRKSSDSERCHSNTMDYKNIFDVDNENRWGVDGDRLDDIANDRD